MQLPELRRIDFNDVDSIKQAELEGFERVSRKHTYEMRIRPKPLTFRAEKASKDHLYEAIKIGQMELRHSRIYQDPHIPFVKAQKVYEGRIKKAFDKDVVFVALLYNGDDHVIGFAALRENEIDLIAVLRPYQRHGVGRSLITRCIDECALAGHKTVVVATQSTNKGASQFYRSMGFDLKQIEQDMHRYKTKDSFVWKG